ncbi:MAG: FAD-dependent oxidoreductase [Victivallaceae bacterium]|nr:FAD-dependent oxidoreductase [Victivallaceae bacterium]
MKTITHQADFCVVGGGLAGMCAAIAAARNGIKTVLMHDRPVLGGNASSEIRMWVCGAHGENKIETGLIEEIRLENLYRNNYPNYSIWDSILYEKVRFQDNLTLLLNCSCNQAQMDGDKIKNITGWQLTTETWHVVEAPLFADCSGDSILAPLSGAETRYGREASSEFGESIEPEIADDKTMGMSCLIQARETTEPQTFIAPVWANKYATDEYFKHRSHTLEGNQNFWWLEIGGEQDTIHDAEAIRDQLLKIGFGVWDHIKNHGNHGADNWVLEWMGFLPGKRESRRYIGDYIMTQNDVAAGGEFADIIAYGGWSMDDHHPEGFCYPGPPTIFHPAPSPYGIPYRALYSRNISNLFCAGRNISTTHAAMSSTRVQATCATLGQAIGTAAVLAVADKLSPRGVYEQKITDLQNMLMDSDCWLPGLTRTIPQLTMNGKLTASSGNPEPLLNGMERPDGIADNCWQCTVDDWLELRFEQPETINEIRLVFDSDLNRDYKNMVAKFPLDMPEYAPPKTLIKGFHLEIEDQSGDKTEVFRKINNYQRLVKISVACKVNVVRLHIDSLYTPGLRKLFAFDVR